MSSFTREQLTSLMDKLTRLDDGVARPVPIAERNCAGEAAKFIQENLDKAPKKTKVMREVERTPDDGPASSA